MMALASTLARAPWRVRVQGRFLFVLTCLGLMVGAAYAKPEPVILADLFSAKSGAYNLMQAMQVAEDKTGELDLEAVLHGALDTQFQPATSRNINPGFTSSTFWVRFDLKFGAELEDLLYLVAEYPLINDIRFYAPGSADAGYSVQRSGDRLPFAERAVDYRNFTFKINPIRNSVQTYYVRMSSEENTLSFPLYLYTNEQLTAHINRTQLIFGSYYGVFLLAAFIALVAALVLRDVVAFWYCAYLSVFTLMMFSLNGFGFQYLWPENVDLQIDASRIFGLMCSFAGLVFMRLFLDTKTLMPRTDRVLKVLLAIPAISLIYHGFSSDQWGVAIPIIFGLALPFVMIVTALRCVMLGNRSARFFLAGWTIHALGIFVSCLFYLGWLPNIVWTEHAMQISSVGEFLLLALALYDRILLAKREKEREIAGINQELLDLNQNLEQLVADRTATLEAKNEELRELAVRDGLTSLYNHSTTMELMEQIGRQSHRYKFPLAIIMLDLDYFKSVNDGYGHQVGDEVLKTVAQKLQASVRDSDVVGRYGGEEFFVILPHADAVAAKDYGERLLDDIRNLEFGSLGPINVTASGGVAVSHPHQREFSRAELIKRADEALYKSKRDGRDRLTVVNLGLVSNA